MAMLQPIGWCYCQVTDIIAIDYVMISVFKADVIAWCCGRCLKPHLADVDCQVADGIATVYSRWQMLLPSGRCYSHNRVVCLVLLLLLEADGRAMGLL